MPGLFDSLRVGALELPNRIVMAPMTRSRAEADGSVPQMVADYYAQRADAGLIVSEAIYVSAMAKGYIRTPGLADANHVAAWRRVTDAVHAKGGRMFAQLFHTGRVAMPDFLPGGAQPVAPSAIAINGKTWTDSGQKEHVVPRALEESEIPATAAEFAAASKRALEAGFDGVEIHAASGYLIHQFLDASINTRTDSFGGSVENRARFLLMVVDRVSEAVGRERVGLKVSPRIKFNDVQDPDAEAVYPYVAEQLSARAIAYLHGAQQGGYDTHAQLRPRFKGLYFAGAGFDQAKGEAMLAAGGADAIVYGTPYIANPDLIGRFRSGAALAQADKATIYGGGAKGYVDYPAAS